MSTSPDELEPIRDYREAPASEIQRVAHEMIALVEEFEATLSEGHAPPAFAERLAQLRKAAERLF